MATITLTYNAQNSLAMRTLEYILSLGVFTATPQNIKEEKALYDPDFVAKIREREKFGFVEKNIYALDSSLNP